MEKEINYENYLRGLQRKARLAEDEMNRWMEMRQMFDGSDICLIGVFSALIGYCQGVEYWLKEKDKD